MPLTLDLLRITDMTHELALMGSRGVSPKRLGTIAMDILLSKAAAKEIMSHATAPEERERAHRAMNFLTKLESQVVRLYANFLATRRLVRRPQMGITFTRVVR